MKAGIVGLPNVGKSTLFNALTAAGAESANYPFCTIEPNVGIVSVPDARLDEINALINTQKIIPAVVEIVENDPKGFWVITPRRDRRFEPHVL